MFAIGPKTISLTTTASTFQNPRKLAFPILALCLLSAFSLWAYTSIQRLQQREVGESMRTILQADISAISTWLELQRQVVTVISSDVDLQHKLLAVLRSFKESSGREASDESIPNDQLPFLQPFVRSNGALQILLTDTQGRIAGGSRAFAPEMQIPHEYAPAFSKIMQGETVVLPPHESMLMQQTEQPKPVIIIAGPIRNDANEVVGSVCLFHSTLDTFSKVLTVARAGESGETYAVDRNAKMLSNSRFDQQLRESGVLSDKEDSMMRVDIRDPGGNLLKGHIPEHPPQGRPMTHAAASLAQSANEQLGDTGIGINPYRDYRGVQVVGAWAWLPTYNFGVITEMDYDEAFAVSNRLLRFLLASLALTMAAMIGLVLFSWTADKVRRRLQRAEKKLERLGQYQLVQLIGRGGMGEVHRAKHEMLRRDTAVKLLRPSFADELSVQRFEREVQSTSQLNNPNTIQIFDFGRTPDGIFYYAMEYLQGIDLSRIVKEFGPVPDGRAIYILRQVCRSLSEAHRAGLIHRDIKASNIMLCERGGLSDFVKVLDFGLVRSVSSENQTLTSDGIVAGTPAYMAPEAMQSPKDTDARSDIYSLGCLAYFLLAGRTPFDGSNPIEICWKHVSETPTQIHSIVSSNVDSKLCDLTMLCLQKDRNKRPQSVDDILAALNHCTPHTAWSQQEATLWWCENSDRVRERNSFVVAETERFNQTVTHRDNSSLKAT